jgi:hypothetical protein
MNTFKYLITFLVCLNIFAVKDYMYFSVSGMDLHQEDTKEGTLSGETIADRIYVNMNDIEFELLSDDKEFVAETYLERGKFTFVKDGMKFATTIAEDIATSITLLNIQNAEVELAKKGLSVKGESLNTNFEDIRFHIANIDMQCATNKFTTDFEEACIKNTTIRPFDIENKSIIVVEDISKEKSFGIDISADTFDIQDDDLTIFSNSIQGYFKKAKFGLKNGSLKCFKDPELGKIDVEQIIYGCLEESDISGESINFNQSALDFVVDRAHVKFGENGFSIVADRAHFRDNDEPTEIKGFEVFCAKRKDLGVRANSTAGRLAGCLNRAEFNIDSIKSESKKFFPVDGGKEKGTDIKEVRAKVLNGKFTVHAKLKWLWRSTIKLRGTVVYDSKPKQLRFDIDRATVSGISTRKLALYFLSKFIDTSRIHISGKSIIIQL